MTRCGAKTIRSPVEYRPKHISKASPTAKRGVAILHSLNPTGGRWSESRFQSALFISGRATRTAGRPAGQPSRHAPLERGWPQVKLRPERRRYRRTSTGHSTALRTENRKTQETRGAGALRAEEARLGTLYGLLTASGLHSTPIGIERYRSIFGAEPRSV